ncbi:hypothetical protein LCGC14_2958040 [marine sediment metagenome]|uniref:Uncharacterized protein n=1 Tax=marine sediment metagenome TaxID=412755 RepID=A0A0F9A4E9_9ZZZZ
MYGLRYLTLISCLALAMSVGAQQPKESHMQDSGRMHKKWVPFDMVMKDISIWRDDDIHEYACQILDWNIMANPHPVLKIMIPPANIFSPIRIAFKLSWQEERPDYWMGINGVSKYTCKFRVKQGVVQIRLQVYE